MADSTTAALSYKIPVACAKLGVSRATIYRMIQAGDLTKHKLRGATVLRHDDLMRLLGEDSAAA
jgi:excisionase family DNA binding protein